MFKTHNIKLKCSTQGCDGHETFEIIPENFNSFAIDLNYWKSEAKCDKCKDGKIKERSREFQEFMKVQDFSLFNILKNGITEK